MAIPISVGQTVPLFVSVEDGRIDLTVLARIISRNPYDVLAEDLLLEPEYFDGDYTNFDFVMPDLPFIDVIYSIYEDDGYTFLRQEREVFVRRMGSGNEGMMTAEITEASTLNATVEVCS